MIILVAMGFYGSGAVSIGARQYARALLWAGHEVLVVTDEAGAAAPEASDLPGRVEVVGVPVYRLPRVEIFGQELSFAWNCHKVVAGAAAKRRVDLVISQISSHCFFLSRFSRSRGIPAAFVIRGLIWDRLENAASHYNPLTKWLYLVSNRHAVRHSPYLISISEYMKSMAVDHGANPEKAYILYNPVDTAVFKPDPDVEKDIDVLYVGRLSVEKGIKTLLEAAKSLPADKRVVIVGDGGLRDRLERTAAGLSCRVEFTGWIDNDDLPATTRRARVQVVPSRSEPQGRVVLEAMACGVPVIGSDTGGIGEMISHGKNGWLFPPGDSKALAGLLAKALADPVVLETMGVAGRTTAESFSIPRFETRLAEMVEDMIARGV
ncbi:MAG: glycosyltransferase family 4 protein [Desulfatibacillaceae bacterium]